MLFRSKGGPLKIPAYSTTITCPNCRLQTENVVCAKNLPENDCILNNGGLGTSGVVRSGTSATTLLLNSPYEAGKRLQRESTNLLSTGDRFLEYLA